MGERREKMNGVAAQDALAREFTSESWDDLFRRGLSAIYLELYRAAQPRLRVRNNDIHTRASCWFAAEILRAKGGDKRIVIPAILLHDVGWSVIGEKRLKGAYGPKAGDCSLVRVHELEGARIAREILEGRGYPCDQTDEICRIISCHDTGLTYETLEEAIVKDADKCYRFTRPAFAYFPDEVGMNTQEWYEWLLSSYRQWMFTSCGFDLAETCLEETRRELHLHRSG